MVNGKWVIRQGKSVLLDEERLEARYRSCLAEVFSKELIQAQQRKLD
jgi:hypothetical protein